MKPSPKSTVTHSRSRSHQAQVADSCHDVSFASIGEYLPLKGQNDRGNGREHFPARKCRKSVKHQREWCSRRKDGAEDLESAGLGRWSTSVRRRYGFTLGRLSLCESGGAFQGKRPRFRLFLALPHPQLPLPGWRSQARLQEQHRRRTITTQATRRLEFVTVAIGFREGDLEVRLCAAVFVSV